MCVTTCIRAALYIPDQVRIQIRYHDQRQRDGKSLHARSRVASFSKRAVRAARWANYHKQQDSVKVEVEDSQLRSQLPKAGSCRNLNLQQLLLKQWLFLNLSQPQL